MLTPLVLALLTLPPVVADPRHGPSSWAMIPAGAASPVAVADGYLVALPSPPAQPDQDWLETVVALASHGAPVIAVGSHVPEQSLLPYLDAVCLEPSPPDDEIPALAGSLAGTPLVLTGRDGAAAVRLLAAGAAAVLVADPPASWASELGGLLPEVELARAGESWLPTAVRGSDLALVVGLPLGFPGGAVELAVGGFARATLLDRTADPVPLTAVGSTQLATVRPLPKGGVLLLHRQRSADQAFEHIGVSGEHLPDVLEVLARHQRVVARQDHLLPRYTARQRLLVRVWVEQLARSFEVVMAGPAYYERGVGSDWEIAAAWVDGVSWDPDELPDLPLLEPRRPPVPPLALRLKPTYRYTLEGIVERSGRRCFDLTFIDLAAQGPGRRHGRAAIDSLTFGLVELEEVAEGLHEEVRSTHSVTAFRLEDRAGVAVWLPSRVVADDLVSAFGGSATVHRELDLTGLVVDPPDFAAGRAATYAGPHRMLRDAPAGVVPLLPDGRGGRTVGEGRRVSQRFLLGGVVYDPGLAYPLPFGGLQVQDFDFRGKGQQLRLFLAGLVNDGAWVARQGNLELSARAFVQLWPFTSSLYERGEEVEAEEIRSTRQRVGAALAGSAGPVRLVLDVGVDRLDFWTTESTAATFVLPSDTFEGVGRLEASAVLSSVTASLAGEAGYRQRWEAWGMAGREKPERAWQRGRLAVVWEHSPFPLARVHLDAELWAGRHLDRFSAASPARFGGIRLRGIASSRVLPRAMAIVRSSVALPLSSRVRGELGVDLAWAREERSGYHARPLSGLGVGITAPGPWGTLLQASVGLAMATPGSRSPTFDLFLLRPLGSKKQ